MTDPTQNLSEISHLFLSGVRDMSGHGNPRPMRIPPPKPPVGVSIDMTPEEFAAAQRGEQPSASLGIAGKDARKIGPVAAILASHFGEQALDQAKAYARHVAAEHNQRVGILELDASLFRMYSVEKTLGSDSGAPAEPAEFEAHQLAEALDEMNWDIDRWLVLVPDPRLPEAKSLLRNVGHWVLLCTGDHEGMVAAYRGLKGLNEGHRPRLSLAVLDADRAEAGRIHHKLSGVCAQFLNWPVAADFTCVAPAPQSVEAHAVLAWRPTHDKAQVAGGYHWKVATDFLHKANAHVIDEAPALTEAEAAFVDEAPAAAAPTHASVAAAAAAQPAPQMDADIPAPLPLIPQSAIRNPQSDCSEVIDLPDGDPAAIVPSLLAHSNGQLVECPVRAPMCPEARLAVTRDRRITLLAVARQGLADLRAIGQAYRWLIENRTLVCMAVPQLAIDPHQHPQLRLIVNHADLSADLLAPMLQSSSVTVQSYRTLRWGAKTGLLLEAA